MFSGEREDESMIKYEVGLIFLSVIELRQINETMEAVN